MMTTYLARPDLNKHITAMQISAEQGRAELAPTIAEDAKCHEHPQTATSTQEEKQEGSAAHRDEDCLEEAKDPQQEKDEKDIEGRKDMNRSQREKSKRGRLELKTVHGWLDMIQVGLCLRIMFLARTLSSRLSKSHASPLGLNVLRSIAHIPSTHKLWYLLLAKSIKDPCRTISRPSASGAWAPSWSTSFAPPSLPRRFPCPAFARCQQLWKSVGSEDLCLDSFDQSASGLLCPLLSGPFLHCNCRSQNLNSMSLRWSRPFLVLPFVCAPREVTNGAFLALQR